MGAVADITAICVRHRDTTKKSYVKTLFVGDEILASWQARIRKHFEMPPDATVIAFYAIHSFRMGRTGFVITDQGISWVSWHQGMSALLFKNCFMDWKTLGEVTIQYSSSFWTAGAAKEDVIFDRQRRYIHRTGSNKLLHGLLLELQEWGRTYAKASETCSLPEAYVDFDTEEEEWMIAFNDQSFGPYDVATIHSLQLSGQITPADTLVWKTGMAEWSWLIAVPQLKPKRSPRPAAPKQRPKDSASPPPLPRRPSNPDPRG